MEKVNVTDHLLKLIRKFLDWLIKITYLQKFKTAIKSWFAIETQQDSVGGFPSTEPITCPPSLPEYQGEDSNGC